jgi:hypothetical protein
VVVNALRDGISALDDSIRRHLGALGFIGLAFRQNRNPGGENLACPHLGVDEHSVAGLVELGLRVRENDSKCSFLGRFSLGLFSPACWGSRYRSSARSRIIDAELRRLQIDCFRQMCRYSASDTEYFRAFNEVPALFSNRPIIIEKHLKVLESGDLIGEEMADFFLTLAGALGAINSSHGERSGL